MPAFWEPSLESMSSSKTTGPHILGPEEEDVSSCGCSLAVGPWLATEVACSSGLLSPWVGWAAAELSRRASGWLAFGPWLATEVACSGSLSPWVDWACSSSFDPASGSISPWGSGPCARSNMLRNIETIHNVKIWASVKIVCSGCIR